VHKKVGARTGYSLFNGIIYLILCLSGIIPTILSLIPVIAVGPIIFIFGLMICEECTMHIKQRHHSAIFFGLFFGVTDYIFTQYGGNPVGNYGPLAMSRGSALSAMVWCTIIVYTTDRRWTRAAFACVVAAGFAAIGLIHQAESVGSEFRKGTGGNIDSTSPFEFMMGYLSMAGVCGIYWVLQTYAGKKTEPGEEGYENDHGYLPPIEEAGVDDIFSTWWDPVKNKVMVASSEGSSEEEGEEVAAQEEEA
jgi:hypothetical protein